MAFTKVIKSSPLLKNIDESYINALLTLHPLVELKKDKYLFKQGDKCDGMYILLEGKISIVLESDGKSSAPIAELEPGVILGEIAVFSEVPRTASARAAVKSSLCFIDLAYIEKALAEKDVNTLQLSHNVGMELAVRIKHSNDMVESLMQQLEMKSTKEISHYKKKLLSNLYI